MVELTGSFGTRAMAGGPNSAGSIGHLEVPPRHVLYKLGRSIEPNSATCKPRRKVHIILLNDRLLIAIEK
jgi:hypothetical protein